MNGCTVQPYTSGSGRHILYYNCSLYMQLCSQKSWSTITAAVIFWPWNQITAALRSVCAPEHWPQHALGTIIVFKIHFLWVVLQNVLYTICLIQWLKSEYLCTFICNCLMVLILNYATPTPPPHTHTLPHLLPSSLAELEPSCLYLFMDASHSLVG